MSSFRAVYKVKGHDMVFESRLDAVVVAKAFYLGADQVEELPMMRDGDEMDGGFLPMEEPAGEPRGRRFWERAEDD